jgi:hypothetical protein
VKSDIMTGVWLNRFISPEKLPYVAVRVRSVSFFIQVNRHSLYKRLVLRAGCVFYPAIVLFFVIINGLK